MEVHWQKLKCISWKKIISGGNYLFINSCVTLHIISWLLYIICNIINILPDKMIYSLLRLPILIHEIFLQELISLEGYIAASLKIHLN